MKALAAGLLLALPVAAAEPCQQQAGNQVCCEAGGFKTLVDKCVDARRDRDLCHIDLKLARDELAALKAAPSPKPERSLKPIAAFLLGAAGAGLTGLSASGGELDPALRVSFAVTGLVSFGLGVWIAVP